MAVRRKKSAPTKKKPAKRGRLFPSKTGPDKRRAARRKPKSKDVTKLVTFSKTGAVATKVAFKKADAAATKKQGTKGKKGMTPFAPTEEQRVQVELLVGLGLTYKEIATVIINPRTGKGVSATTLQDHFGRELEQGLAKVKANVVRSLVKKAISDNHPQAAICAMFIAKCRFGWRQEDKLIHEVDVASTGVLVAPALISPEQWIKAQREKNATKKPPKDHDDK